MVEWWTYRPSDFLMFAPATYWRLFELHNLAWWPAPPLLVAAGIAIMAALWRRRAAPALRALAVVLALGWGFSGWAFVAQRYAPINWAAEALAWACAVPAAALVALALRQRAAPPVSPVPARCRAGLVLLAWAVAGHPLLAPLSGRPWLQAEVWLLAPDPTVAATLGWLLASPAGGQRVRWLRVPVWMAATGWCMVSAATLWTMGSVQGWVMAALPLAALATRRPRGAP